MYIAARVNLRGKKEKMKAFGLDMTNIQGQATGVNPSAGKTLFGNDVATSGEFANLMDILGGAKGKETPNLMDVLTAAKDNPDALTKLPKDVLQFISQEFRFDGKTILNDQGKPIQVQDIMSKIQELKPELLSETVTPEKMVNQGKEAKAMEVRNLLKSHDLGMDAGNKASKNLFTSGNDFVQVKESAQPAATQEGIKNLTQGSKKTNAFSQYSKESQLLQNNLISNNGPMAAQVELPGAAVGMTQFKGGADFEMLTTQQKVVDLSHVNPSNTTSLIDQVTKLIEQNNIKTADSMDVVVKHEDLGQFKIEVNRNANTDQLDMRIISKDKAGHNFFVENEAQLAKTLNQSGIKLSSFKVALSAENAFTSNTDGGGKDFSGEFSQNRGQQGQFNGRQGENADSQRRRQLWQAFKENAQYASA